MLILQRLGHTSALGQRLKNLWTTRKLLDLQREILNTNLIQKDENRKNSLRKKQQE